RYSRIIASDGTDKFIDHAYSGHLPAPRPGTPLGAIPLIKPPWSRLTAVDLNKGEIVWQAPVGEGSAVVRNHPLLKGVRLPDRLGSPSNGGSVLTGSGLIFIGGGDGYLYAFDKNGGQELWRGRLPYVNAENIMTYRTRAGRQFVLASTGAGADAALVAFALDSTPRTTSGTTTRQDAGQLQARGSGQAAFDRVCSMCHGREARGDIAPRLVRFSREPDELLAMVREGIGQMPPISARDISDED